MIAAKLTKTFFLFLMRKQRVRKAKEFIKAGLVDCSGTWFI